MSKHFDEVNSVKEDSGIQSEAVYLTKVVDANVFSCQAKVPQYHFHKYQSNVT